MEQQDQLHRRLMQEERRSPRAVQAHRWIGRLPPPRPGSDPIERIEEMAQRLISPRPSTTFGTPFSGSTSSLHRPSPLRQNQHLRERIRELEAENRQLMATLAQSHQRTQNEQLNDAIRSAQLWMEAHTNEQTRREDAERQKGRLLDDLRLSERDRIEREGEIRALQAQLYQHRHTNDLSSEVIVGTKPERQI